MNYFIIPLIPIILLLFSCYSTYDGPLDLSEQQSVWQYLNVYSIYQERLPYKAGDLTPEALFRSINDTLKGGRYTGYYGMSGASVHSASAAANSDGVLRITDSTAYYRLSEFSDVALGNFSSWRTDSILLYSPNLVIDLRDNGGGSINVTDSIISDFVPFDAPYISTRYREYDYYRNVGRTIEWRNTRNAKSPRLAGKNISVIMDSNSASASEILAAALKDCVGAHLVGDTSYGKGIGQVHIWRNERRDMSVTFMEIRSVPGGKVAEAVDGGMYHRVGIPPDPIDDALLKEAADSCLVDRDLYVAVKLLDGLAKAEQIRTAADSIQRAGLRKSLGRRAEGYVVVVEGEAGVDK